MLIHFISYTVSADSEQKGTESDGDYLAYMHACFMIEYH